MSAADSELSRWPDLATASIRTQSIRSTVAQRSSSAIDAGSPSIVRGRRLRVRERAAGDSRARGVERSARARRLHRAISACGRGDGTAWPPTARKLRGRGPGRRLSSRRCGTATNAGGEALGVAVALRSAAGGDEEAATTAGAIPPATNVEADVHGAARRRRTRSGRSRGERRDTEAAAGGGPRITRRSSRRARRRIGGSRGRGRLRGLHRGDQRARRRGALRAAAAGRRARAAIRRSTRGDCARAPGRVDRLPRSARLSRSGSGRC